MARQTVGTARRQLTVLFSDLTDSTRLVAELESEDYADLLGVFRQAVERVIPRYGGIIVQVRGDGCLAMFGMQAREDESRYATEAALELHAAVKAIRCPTRPDLRLNMHSGIHSGLVLLIDGDSVYGRYVLAGDPPHVASRLSDCAGPDEILVSADSLGADLHFFAAGERRSLRIKSLSERLQVYPIIGRTEIHTRYEARRHQLGGPIIGRRRELDQLRAAFENANSPAMRLVCLVAPPGTGKTRLVEEFLHSVNDTRTCILRGNCDQHLDVEPLQPLAQIVLQALELPPGSRHAYTKDLIHERLTAIAPSLAPSAALISEFLQHRKTQELQLRQCLANLCRSLADKKTLVLFVDDWQWADDELRRFYAALTTPQIQNQPVPILVITSSRDAPATQEHATVINLSPLTPELCRDFIGSLIPGADPFLAARLERASGGNPLFLEELCHSVAETNHQTRLAFQEPRDSKQLPNYLNMLIASRISHLPGDQADLVRAAAVIGNVVPLWLLEAITGRQDLTHEVSRLAEEDLLFPIDETATFRFKHGITREVVFATVGLRERRRLHLTIAETLLARHTAEPVSTPQLAYHFSEAQAFDQAAFYAEQAGDHAMAAATLDRARHHYLTALRSLDQLELTDDIYSRWMSIVQRLAMACLYDATFDQLKTHERALELAESRGDIANTAEAEYRLAYINYALGEGPAALGYSRRAAATVAQMDAETFAVQITATLGQTLALNSCYDEAIPVLTNAIDRQRPFKQKARIKFAFAYSLASRGMIFGDLGRFEEAQDDFNEASALINGINHEIHASVIAMRAAVYVWQGRWLDADNCGSQTISIANQMGSEYMYASGMLIKDYANWQLGHTESLAGLRRGIEWIERQDQALWTSLHYSWMAEVLATTGQIDGARHYAAKTLLRGRRGERLGEAAAYCALGAVTRDQRSRERYFDKAQACADKRRSPREQVMTAWRRAVAFQTTEPLAACEDEFSRMGMFWHAAQAQSLR